jgi:hypothetical protein
MITITYYHKRSSNSSKFLTKKNGFVVKVKFTFEGKGRVLYEKMK